MPAPRQVLPGLYYLLTRRCSQRQFLLRPDAATNNAYLYCLIEAAKRFQIDVLMMCAMSNHHHVVIRDRLGNYPQFIEHMHKMIARSQNALRGRWEYFWASGQTSVVALMDREAILSKVAYVATNPVNDHLVDRVHHWPGINGFHSLLSGRPLRATRPRHFFRVTGPMPDAVEMTLGLPEELGDSTELLHELEQRVSGIEVRAAADRVRSGRKVLGRRAILNQSWRSSPATFEPRRAMSPRIATRDVWARIAEIVRIRWFVKEYARAREAWLAGTAVAFPAGTYWLRRFAAVPVASA